VVNRARCAAWSTSGAPNSTSCYKAARQGRRQTVFQAYAALELDAAQDRHRSGLGEDALKRDLEHEQPIPITSDVASHHFCKKWLIDYRVCSSHQGGRQRQQWGNPTLLLLRVILCNIGEAVREKRIQQAFADLRDVGQRIIPFTEEIEYRQDLLLPDRLEFRA
jgi:hypothetical protein